LPSIISPQLTALNIDAAKTAQPIPNRVMESLNKYSAFSTKYGNINSRQVILSPHSTILFFLYPLIRIHIQSDKLHFAVTVSLLPALYFSE